MARSRTTRRAGAFALVVAVLVGAGGSGSAQADPLSTAEHDAAAAAAAVEALEPRLAAAEDGYAAAMGDLASRASAAIRADTAAEQARQHRFAAHRAHATQVRSLYMSGGQVAWYASLLSAGTPDALLGGVQSLHRVIAAGDARVASADARADAASTAAQRAGDAAEGAVVTVRDVQDRAAQLQDVLTQAQARLDGLSARASSLRAARRAAALLAAARARADAASAAAVRTATARLAPEAYQRLYVAAAATCPGLPWTVLSAIGQVESGHGANPSTSSAGAQGPMQFLPSTFAGYATDGDRDGIADIQNPADAVFTAARYLCANGGGDPARLPRAIWHYNHAQWYVDLVLSIANQLAATSIPTSAPTSSQTSTTTGTTTGASATAAGATAGEG